MDPKQESQQPVVPQTPAEPTQPSTPVVQPSESVSSAPVQSTAPTSQPTQQPDMTAMKTELETSLTEKVSKAFAEKIGKALGLNKEEEAKLPTDPKEMQAYIDARVGEGIQRTLTEREQAEKAERDTQQQQVSAGAQRFQNLWKDQYTQLSEAGHLPKIINGIDKNDPGMVAKGKLLMKLSQVLQENQAKGLDYVPTLKEIYYEYGPEVLRTEVAGANVPVSGGGRAMAGNQGLTYDQLHKADVEDLIKASHQG